MIYKGLSLQGFRSFSGDHVLHFPTGRGVFFVAGRNEANPRLGANGVGKSSIWDGLAYVLFGKTTRKLKAGDVASWNGEYCTILALDFEKNGINYSITRSWSPNSLTLQVEEEEPKTTTQEDIDELCGMNYDLFLSTVVMSQFGKSFMELSKPDKLARFSRVLGLDEWADRSQVAKDDAAKEERECVREDTKVVRLTATLDERKKTLRDALESDATWEDQAAAMLEAARRYSTRCVQAQETVEKTLADLRKDHSEGVEWIAAVEQEQIKRSDIIASIDKECHELDAQLNQVNGEAGAVHRQSVLLEGATGDCPTCAQKVPEEHKKSTLSDLTHTLTDFDTSIREVRADMDRVHAKRTKARSQWHEKDQGLRAKRGIQNRVDREIAKADERLRSAVRDVETGNIRIRQGEEEESPHAKTIEETKGRIVTLERDLDAAKAALRAAQDRKQLAQYAQQLFKDLRLWVCEDAMLEYSVVMNGALQQLGLLGFEVRCDLERPTKKGGVSPGFQVLVRNELTPDWVKWEVWSGGESQRLCLSGDVSFADLVSSRMGLHPSIEVWDEPTQHLSVEGVEHLLAYLRTRARTKSRQIFLVDHRSVEAGEFAGHYTVVLDEMGSRIETDVTRGNRCSQHTNKESTRRRFLDLRTTV